MTCAFEGAFFFVVEIGLTIWESGRINFEIGRIPVKSGLIMPGSMVNERPVTLIGVLGTVNLQVKVAFCSIVWRLFSKVGLVSVDWSVFS